MNIVIDTNANYWYLLYNISKGQLETNQRTKTRILISPHPEHITLDCREGLPILGNRKYFPHIAAAELAWQYEGTKYAKLIMDYAPKLWSKFLVDEKVEAAYGYRWRKHFGRDQLKLAIEALRADPTNRQVHISAWDPGSDGLGQKQSRGVKNLPCPTSFTLSLSSYLNCSVHIRSSDVMIGLPYDMMCYGLLLLTVAKELNLKPGFCSFQLASRPYL